MKAKSLHSWDVSPREAKEIQYRLREKIVDTWDGRNVSLIAGADVAFPEKTTVLAAVVVLTFPDLRVVETHIKSLPCRFPYVPGLLAFREAPALLACLDELRLEPDVLLCDAQGLAHPRKMGLATHVGILLDHPVVGCAKSVLYGTFEPPGEDKGSFSYMYDDSGEVIGAAVRTRDHVEPVYVSIGNKIDLTTSIDLVLKCSPKYRIPEPLRLAHRLSVGEKVECDEDSIEGQLF